MGSVPCIRILTKRGPISRSGPVRPLGGEPRALRSSRKPGPKLRYIKHTVCSPMWRAQPDNRPQYAKYHRCMGRFALVCKEGFWSGPGRVCSGIRLMNTATIRQRGLSEKLGASAHHSAEFLTGLLTATGLSPWHRPPHVSLLLRFRSFNNIG